MMNLASIVGDSAVAVAITAGLTQSVKSALPKLEGGIAFLLAIVVGLIVTAGLDYSILLPITIQDWVLVILHGLIVGLTASGLYKIATQAPK